MRTGGSPKAQYPPAPHPPAPHLRCVAGAGVRCAAGRLAPAGRRVSRPERGAGVLFCAGVPGDLPGQTRPCEHAQQVALGGESLVGASLRSEKAGFLCGASLPNPRRPRVVLSSRRRPGSRHARKPPTWVPAFAGTTGVPTSPGASASREGSGAVPLGFTTAAYASIGSKRAVKWRSRSGAQASRYPRRLSRRAAIRLRVSTTKSRCAWVYIRRGIARRTSSSAG